MQFFFLLKKNLIYFLLCFLVKQVVNSIYSGLRNIFKSICETCRNPEIIYLKFSIIISAIIAECGTWCLISLVDIAGHQYNVAMMQCYFMFLKNQS